MKLRDYLLIGFATPLLVSLTGKAGLGFSFTMPASEPDVPCTLNSNYCSSTSYTEPGLGTVVTKLKPVTELPLGGTDDLLNLLSDSVWADNGWSFERSNRDLDGIFNIGVYVPSAAEDIVGGEIQVRYEPKIQDPTQTEEQPEIQDPIGNSVHFIQRVVNNHGLTRSVIDGTTLEPYGTTQDKIDTVTEQTDPTFIDARNIDKSIFNPFYDTYGIHQRYTNEMILFRDLTGRPNIFDAHDWYAELYLVEETAPKKVRIYNGISWGWENEFTPEDPKSEEPSSSCNSGSGGGGSGGGSGGGGCSDNNGWGDERDDRELPLFEEDEFDEDDFYVDSEDSPRFEFMSGLCQSQDSAVLPSETDEDWKVFNDVPSTCWFDPETNYGFEFQALDNTLFTELLDFPTGIDTDDRFTVQVGEEILGEFSPGESVDFVSLLGSGVAEFKVLDIQTQQDVTDVPFKVGFDRAQGSFQMRSLPEPEEIPQSIPEPGSVAGILTIGLLGVFGRLSKYT